LKRRGISSPPKEGLFFSIRKPKSNIKSKTKRRGEKKKCCTELSLKEQTSVF